MPSLPVYGRRTLRECGGSFTGSGTRSVLQAAGDRGVAEEDKH